VYLYKTDVIIKCIASMVVLDFVNYREKVLGKVEKTALYLFKLQKNEILNL